MKKKTQKTTKNACCSFLDNKKQKVFFGDVWFFRLNDIYYWKRKIMSKTIIITIHFPILFIIIISLFTFYLSFIFCAITLINSILKKYHFSLLSIYIFNFCFHIFSKFCLYTMIIENIKTTPVSLPTKEWLANNRNNFTK